MTGIEWSGIPGYMQHHLRWSVFRRKYNHEKKEYDKQICTPTGGAPHNGYPDVNNSYDFTDFTSVKKLCELDHSFIPAFYILKSDRLIFLDFDAPCTVPDYPTYTERSLNGGFHVVGFYDGDKPTLPDTKEIYIDKRWMISTGNVVDGKSGINDITDHLKQYTHKDEEDKIPQFKIPTFVIEGERHNFFRSLVLSLVSKELSFEAILAACLAENIKSVNPPSTEPELTKLIVNLYDWASKKKRVKDQEPKREKTPEQTLAKDCIFLTEVSAAERFVKVIDGDYLYNVDTKKWHRWTGKVWEIDYRNQILNRCREFVKTLYSDIGEAIDRKMFFKEVERLNNNRSIKNIVELAGLQLTRRSEDFDIDYHILNVQNGTIEFNNDGTIKLREHCKSDMCSLICGCDYDPEVSIPDIWTKHIKKISAENEGWVDTLQTALGYLIEGGNPLEIILFTHGNGRNGKSVTLRTLSGILGGYAVTVNPLTLMEHGNDTKSPERLKMRNVRLILAQEGKKAEEDHIKDTTTLDTAFLKSASGKDKISARMLNSNVVHEFVVSGLVVLSTNHLPKINDRSIAIWERLVLVPFDYYFEPKERDDTIEDAFKTHKTGILNWFVEGWKRYKINKKIPKCEAATLDLEEYKGTDDEFAGFISTGITEKIGNLLPATELYSHYLVWCNKNRAITVNVKSFGEVMGDRYQKKRMKTGVYYRNIARKDFIFQN